MSFNTFIFYLFIILIIFPNASNADDRSDLLNSLENTLKICSGMGEPTLKCFEGDTSCMKSGDDSQTEGEIEISGLNFPETDLARGVSFFQLQVLVASGNDVFSCVGGKVAAKNRRACSLVAQLDSCAEDFGYDDGSGLSSVPANHNSNPKPNREVKSGGSGEGTK